MPTSASATARQRLVDVIGSSVYQALGLKESLEDERRALEAQDMEELDRALESKSRCLAALQTLEQERREVCSQAGFGPGPGDMRDMANWCDEGAVVANGWEQLMTIASECNRLNMTNGAIIRVRKEQIEASLAVLRGDVLGTQTYEADGTGSGGTAARSLAEA